MIGFEPAGQPKINKVLLLNDGEEQKEKQT